MLGFTYEELYLLNQEFENKELEQKELLNSLRNLKTDENLISKIDKLVSNIPFATPF